MDENVGGQARANDIIWEDSGVAKAPLWLCSRLARTLWTAAKSVPEGRWDHMLLLPHLSPPHQRAFSLCRPTHSANTPDPFRSYGASAQLLLGGRGWARGCSKEVCPSLCPDLSSLA